MVLDARCNGWTGKTGRRQCQFCRAGWGGRRAVQEQYGWSRGHYGVGRLGRFVEGQSTMS